MKKRQISLTEKSQTVFVHTLLYWRSSLIHPPRLESDLNLVTHSREQSRGESSNFSLEEPGQHSLSKRSGKYATDAMQRPGNPTGGDKDTSPLW